MRHIGYWDKRGADAPIVEQMAMRIQYPTPDDAGVWLNEKCDLALVQWHLSIIDLTPAGHQPMTSPCGRFIIVRVTILSAVLVGEGGRFDLRDHSDTMTLLMALRHCGVEGVHQRVNGMFAFAL